MDFTTFFKKRIEPFIAIAVLAIVIIIFFQLKAGLELREEISENCGWGDENYRCFCEKSEALAIKAKIGNNFTFNVDEVENVPMAG